MRSKLEFHYCGFRLPSGVGKKVHVLFFSRQISWRGGLRKMNACSSWIPPRTVYIRSFRFPMHHKIKSRCIQVSQKWKYGKEGKERKKKKSRKNSQSEIKGAKTSDTREDTIAPNAPPMMIPIAKSNTFPCWMNSRKVGSWICWSSRSSSWLLIFSRCKIEDYFFCAGFTERETKRRMQSKFIVLSPFSATMLSIISISGFAFLVSLSHFISILN